ncbi:bacteriorhodopsin [Halovenus rubra]|uniref:Bacteriorhodopsin n=2 Tax=Halovenus rubra TaxID=869890 RepID=A0ACC7E0N0_9EURY|nr:bacteriorhodopsin [Halovenus rubra]
MTDPILLSFAVAYAVSSAVLFAWVRRVPVQLREYCYPLLGLVVLAAVTHTLSGLTVGVIDLGSAEFDVFNVIDGSIAYGVLFGAAALLADVTRRQLWVAVALPATMNVAFQGAAVTDGILALVGALIVIFGYPVLCWLYFRSFVETVRQTSRARQRLYRKFRNLLLFLIGFLILIAFTSLDFFVSDISDTLIAYVDFLLRVGFAGFLFANISVFYDFEASVTADS